ncbi:hypothetical protein [Plantibacter flavus]|uniref:hypothetical protein n=1 Tax=Plantibacter flavus TaxID=150123 RepID=UPI0033979EC7
MTERTVRETKEWIRLLGTLITCGIIAVWLILTIPIVNKLPEGTGTVAEYVVNATVARFGLPVVVFLFLASLIAALGHNKGDGRPGLDFAAKVCSFGASAFSLFAVSSGLCVSATFPA